MYSDADTLALVRLPLVRSSISSTSPLKSKTIPEDISEREELCDRSRTKEWTKKEEEKEETEIQEVGEDKGEV